jgi:glycosyltransferase involved in cell wall biosynthesis
MTSTPLVTIYLPTHSRRDLLERAVESVLSQTYTQLELIVIDDGSTDDTAAWLDQRARQDARLVPLYHATSMGAPRSRNEAILHGHGEFITGLDDDDYFHPQRLERMVERWQQLEAREQTFSCIFTQDMYIGDGADRISRKPARVSCNDLYFYNTIGNQIFTRRQWFIDAGLFDESMPAWQDLDVFIRVLRLYGPALLLDEPLQYLSLDLRPDRISVGSKERFLNAYRKISAKPHASPLLCQGLFLQIFGYRFRFAPGDLVEFFGYGLHLRTLKTLVRVLARSAASVMRFS